MCRVSWKNLTHDRPVFYSIEHKNGPTLLNFFPLKFIDYPCIKHYFEFQSNYFNHSFGLLSYMEVGPTRAL